jgi:hypothetical protein
MIHRPRCGFFATLAWLAVATPAMAAAPPSGQGDSAVVAEVFGQPITRKELIDELLARRGKQQLELLINRRIIDIAAQRAGIVVTDTEVENELRDIMRAAGAVTASEFERGHLKPLMQMSVLEYKEDVLRPGMMMRRLAGSRVQVTEADLKQAFEARYGEKVQCRMIILDKRSRKLANELHAQIAGNKANFIAQAQRQGNRDLAAAGGLVEPIGRHTLNDVIEQRAFELRDNEVSEVIEDSKGQLVLLLRERLIPPDRSRNFDAERPALERIVLEEKAKQEVPKLMKELRAAAKVQDFLNNKFDIKSYLEQLGGP